ncbi:MAG: sensor histidine kinase, partial [Pararhizobium sp.]
ADAEQVLRKLGTIERQIDETEGGSRYMMRILPYRTIDNVIAGVVITFVDVTEITRAEERIKALSQSLRNRVENLETLLELVPAGILIAEDDGSETTLVNRHGAELLGRQHGEEKLLSIPIDLPLAKAREKSDQPLRKASRTGEPVPAFEGRIERRDGNSIDVLISANPLFNEAGEVRGAIASMVDITFRKQAEARQQELLHELQHRVKNILATTTALASRIATSSTSVEQFLNAFIERLRAMARTHEVLSKHNWEGADLKSLVTTALAPYANDDRSNIVTDGPPVTLKPGATTTFGMVLFELANNAAKYGAFASGNGHVELSWNVRQDEEPRLDIAWLERDGAPVVPPSHDGFGTQFIRKSLQYELDGSVELRFEPTGLECTFSLPLKMAAVTESRGREEEEGNGR